MRVVKRSMRRRDLFRRGAAAAELAIVAPFLAFILLIAIDFSRLFFAYNTITNAARNGALWASDPYANPAIGTVTAATSQSPYTSVQAAALADANDLNPALTSSNITVSPSTPTTGSNVAVTVQYPFKLITSYLGFSTATLSKTVTMQVAPTAPN